MGKAELLLPQPQPGNGPGDVQHTHVAELIENAKKLVRYTKKTGFNSLLKAAERHGRWLMSSTTDPVFMLERATTTSSKRPGGAAS